MFKCKNCSQEFNSYLEWSSHFMVNYLKRNACSSFAEPEVSFQPMEPKKILNTFTELFQTNLGEENYKLSKENEMMKKELEILRKQNDALNKHIYKQLLNPVDSVIIDNLKEEIRNLQKKNTELSQIKNYLMSIDSVRYKNIIKTTILVEWIDKLLNGEDLTVEELEKFENIKENNDLADEIGIEIDPEIKDMDLLELTKQMGLISD